MAEQNEENKNKIDLNNILLPKKEVHTPASAERVNAGVLLAQEQEAATKGITPAPAPTPAPTPTPTPPLKPKKEESVVQPIQTYKSDVESLVQEKDVSVVSIAAAEAKKREQVPIVAAPEVEHWILKRTSLVIGGVLLIAIAGGALVYVTTQPTTVAVTPLGTAAPFITVDDTKQISIDPTAPSASIMQTLNSARTSVNLSLGLIERLYVTEGSGNNAQEIPINTLLSALAPQAPQALLRTLTGQYLLGVHSFDENQAFLMLHTDSYETAYAAMLQWEPTMSHDLLPLFMRTAPVHIQSVPSPVGTSTATSSSQNASTTPKDYFAASTTTLPTPTIAQSGLPITFADRVVENHDARVLQTKAGDILLMWTFLDRNTVVIATNEFTLRELIARITNAPTINLPQ